MLQASAPPVPSGTDPSHVHLLREELRRRDLDGFIIPRQDEFQGEYVAPYAERLHWLTGFAGSWGIAILMRDRGAIFVDGRYTVQVREQVDPEIFVPHHLVEDPPAKWLEAGLKAGEVVGYDPWLVTADQASNYAKACAKAGARLLAVTGNPVDAVWSDQPRRPQAPIRLQPLQFAGRSSKDKLAEAAETLAKADAEAAVLAQPDSVAWLFNIRGQDVAYTPIALAYAIVRRDGLAELFINPSRVPEDVLSSLAGIVELKAPEAFEASLQELARNRAHVLLDADSTPDRIKTVLADSGAVIVSGRDPCTLPKARKNAVEQEGMRAAHRRDGVAMCRFLYWLSGAGPDGGETELSVAAKLQDFRAASGQLQDLSFDTIAAAGPHAAIPHYHVTTQSSLPLEMNQIFLVDSGGQYQDGTTDITRTIIVGEPTTEMRDRFTRVLKGMIGISRARFPKGTCGSQIDLLARQHLWNAGLDFDHGTGHGVGAYLSVHEGPARINKSDRTPLQPGMILSNEPGYYKPGDYGIRIENLVLVREAEPRDGGDRLMHWFETLTLCPIDRRLVDPSLLTQEERLWLDTYHARVLRDLGPFLDAAERAWLAQACAPISP